MKSKQGTTRLTDVVQEQTVLAAAARFSEVAAGEVRHVVAVGEVVGTSIVIVSDPREAR